MKVGVIGAVGTSLITISALIKHGFEIVGILGHEPNKPELVSGLQNLSQIAYTNNIPYKGFQKINDIENIKWMQLKRPQIIFAVGFSQLLNEEWLKMPQIGCIGFHPTKLPKGRGRAPMAWTILEENEGAATIFLMGNGTDDGPIFVQEFFSVSDNDNIESIREKIYLALNKGLDKWLPELRNGAWDPIPQEEKNATYYGKRNPEDSLINWTKTAEEIHRLIRASSKPYPGAYTFFKKTKLIIWKAEIENSLRIKGVPGRVLIKKNDNILIQCGDGLLWLTDFTLKDGLVPNVGNMLGYIPELEIFNLWNEIEKLRNA